MQFQIISALAFILAFSSASKAADDCFMSKDPDERIAACNRQLADKNRTTNNRSISLSNRGLAWARKKDYERAIQDYDLALALNPANASALINRGGAHQQRGEIAKALVDLMGAVALNPADARPRVTLGNIYFDLKQYENALREFNSAIRLDSKSVRGYGNRGFTKIILGDFDGAIEDLDTAIKLAPSETVAYASRGLAWRMKGDLEKALADQDLQIRILPNAESYILRGDTRRYVGDLTGALDDYEKALSLEPEHIAALVGRGLTYEKMGNFELARSNFEKAISSKSQIRASIALIGLETAKARIAALNSGETQPVIPAVPMKFGNAKSVPTIALVPSRPIAAERAQITAAQGRRVALVIGNSAYKNVSALNNPQNDADAIAKSLRNIGFENVTVTKDGTREKMIDALRNFANEAEKSEWAMVYYAGHGMEVGGVNYLIPIDAKIAVDRDIQFEAVPLTQVLNAADTAKKIKLVVLDACRDNPFKPRQTAAPEVAAASTSTAGAPIATRSTNGRGLAEVKVQGATLVVYAAKDGQVALDGEGGNSPFAVAVVQRLATPGVEINKLFRLVRDDVMEATAGRQEPYTYGSLPGKEDFFFVAK